MTSFNRIAEGILGTLMEMATHTPEDIREDMARQGKTCPPCVFGVKGSTPFAQVMLRSFSGRDDRDRAYNEAFTFCSLLGADALVLAGDVNTRPDDLTDDEMRELLADPEWAPEEDPRFTRALLVQVVTAEGSQVIAKAYWHLDDQGNVVFDEPYTTEEESTETGIVQEARTALVTKLLGPGMAGRSAEAITQGASEAMSDLGHGVAVVDLAQLRESDCGNPTCPLHGGLHDEDDDGGGYL